MTHEEFYDPQNFAIVPMGFCFPGQDAKGSDLPPRRECAPAWRAPLMALMPQIDLVLTIGLYAQALAYGRRAARFADRDGDELARGFRRAGAAARAALAASVLAQHRLAETQSLV